LKSAAGLFSLGDDLSLSCWRTLGQQCHKLFSELLFSHLPRAAYSAELVAKSSQDG